MQFKNKSSGFTLLEILLVVGIISILAGIVIVAINPSKQLATVRNTERKSDIKQIDSALAQYYIDHNHYPASLSSSLTEICDTGGTASSSVATELGANYCSGLINLSELVPTYLTAIPTDPQASSTSNGGGYSVIKASGKVGLSAPAELGVSITLGVATGTEVVTPPGGGGCDVSSSVTPTIVSGHKIYTFTEDGTFTVNTGTCNAEILVVAGGGGGSLGGGGAGGLISTSTTLTNDSLDIVVGDGGAGGTAWPDYGRRGSDSYFGNLIAYGGGGGIHSSNNQQDGGSGGGGGYAISQAAGSGYSGQGNNGGNGILEGWYPGAGYYPAGGGGGVGGAGGDAIGDSTGGAGGIGRQYSQFASVGGSPAGWFAGGGGGATQGGGTGGTGGQGGGGDGVYDQAGKNGAQNTGGGGGGGAAGGTGGSGIVIVRYAI